MKDWLVPPIVIPFVLVVTLAAYALFRVHFSQRYHKHSNRCPSPAGAPLLDVSCINTQKGYGFILPG